MFGQGDATFIITPQKKNILIDTGGSKVEENFDVGDDTLVPYLLDRGVNQVDYLMISHFDADHCNGAIAVINKLKVKQMIISKQEKECNEYKNIMKLAENKNIEIRVVKAGDTIFFDKYTYFKVIHPQEKLISENILNNNSIVGKLIYKKFSMLFTGDIEEIAEKQILYNYKNNLDMLNSTILKVGHHGSKTSSIKEFINKVNPKIALIGVGENNTFGHPNEDVIKRFEELRNRNI